MINRKCHISGEVLLHITGGSARIQLQLIETIGRVPRPHL